MSTFGHKGIVAAAKPFRLVQSADGPYLAQLSNEKIAANVLYAAASYLRYVDWREDTAADALDAICRTLGEEGDEASTA